MVRVVKIELRLHCCYSPSGNNMLGLLRSNKSGPFTRVAAGVKPHATSPGAVLKRGGTPRKGTEIGAGKAFK